LIDCGIQYVTYSVDSTLVSKTYKDLFEMFDKKITDLKG